MRAALTIGALLAALSAVAPARAAQPARTYVIALGYNGAPAGPDAGLQPLRFADDDALAFFEFIAPSAARSHLLTAFDADTQRRLGDRAPPAKPPSVAELLAAVADVRQAIDEDARTGLASTVYVYYSGHGTQSEGGEAALTLIDGLMTRRMLYDEVLGALPAAHVHLFVDSCHAEAVVRPRDAQAEVVPLSRDDLAHYEATTLSRLPYVGVVLASTRNAQAHEWEVYQGGIFTHELLSGLRGAADVNGDRRIEYSELAAFLSAANREVRDPRAHLDAVTHPPSQDLRAAIVDLTSWPASSVIETSGAPIDAFSVEDERGDRIADVRTEGRHPVRIVVPAGHTLYVRCDRGEATVRPAVGERIALEALAFRTPSMNPRGAVEAALHRGLFAVAYGPAYYRGFVDRAGDLVSVPLPIEGLHRYGGAAEARRAGNGASTVLGWSSIGAASAMAVGAAVFGEMALQNRPDVGGVPPAGVASATADRFARDATAASLFAGAAVTAAVAGVYFLVRSGHHGRPASYAALNAAAMGFDF